MMTRRLYIETVGCQMNMLDSEMVVADLRKHGYALTSDIKQADTILYNTCSVRAHAEDKVYSALGRLKLLKQRHPEKIIGVIGCMAQKDQTTIFDRAPYVDLIVGPGQLREIPSLIEKIQAGGEHKVAVAGRAAGAILGQALVGKRFQAQAGQVFHRRLGNEGERVLAVLAAGKNDAVLFLGELRANL